MADDVKSIMGGDEPQHAQAIQPLFNAADEEWVTLTGRYRFLSHPRSIALILINQISIATIIVYGFDFLWPPHLKDMIYTASSGFFVAELALTIFYVSNIRSWGGPHESAGQTAALLCIFQTGLTEFFFLPTHAALAVIALTFAVGAALMRYASHVVAVGWAMAIGFALYVGSILTITDYGHRADMLPFIAHAIDIFWAGGDPYTADFSHIDKNPFFYPPAQWLIFLPAQVFGIDLRIVNLFSAAAMVALVEWHARRGEPALRAGVYPIMLSPLTLPMMYTGQIWPYWLAILCLALLALSGRWAWAALVAAIAIGIRQTALAPTAALAAALIGRLRSASLLRVLSVGVVTLAVSVLPFVHSRAAFEMMLVQGPRIARDLAHAQGNPANQIAASNLLEWLGLDAWDSRIEAAVALLTMGIAWLAARRSMRAALTVAGLGYALAVSFNPYVFRYYYVAGLLLAAIGLTASRDPSFREPESNAESG